MSLLPALLRLTRLPNTLTAGADVLAGAAVAGRDPLAPPVLLAALGSAFLYGGGVALNDLWDLEKDRVHHPRRPLPAGHVSPRAATMLVLVLLPLGAASALPAGGLHLAVTAVLLLLVVLYDRLPDDRRLLGSTVMGGCRALNILRGLTLAPLLSPERLLLPAAGHLVLIFMVTAVSTLEGRTPPRRLPGGASLLLVLPYLVPAFLCENGVLSPTGIVVLAAACVLAVHAALPMLRAPSAPGLVVRNAVFSLVLFDALYVLSSGRVLAAGILALCLPLIHLLARALDQPGS